MGCVDDVGFSVDDRVPCPKDWSEMSGCSGVSWYDCQGEEGLNFPGNLNSFVVKV